MRTVTQCDAIRSMTGNVASSSNHPRNCDCLKLEIVTYLIQTSVTYVKKHRFCNNAVFGILFSLITINRAGRRSGSALDMYRAFHNVLNGYKHL